MSFDVQIKIFILQNVIGLKDKDITIEIESAGDIITVTVIPSFIYDHMIKKYVAKYKE